MIEFYQKIEQLNANCRNVAVTVLSGYLSGEKALYCDGRLLWQSVEDPVFTIFETTADQLADSGQITTEDGMMLYAEILGQEKKIVICGGGHVSIPLIQLGLMTGCEVTVLEDRPEFAGRAGKAGASRVICMPFEKGLEQIDGDGDTFFVIVTRGHQYDKVCLEQISKKPHAYIGMIGSRKRTALVKEEVLKNGAPPQVISRIHAPIGLSIGAETPEEIAVAIAAEIIQVKNRHKDGGYPSRLLKAIQSPGRKVLATIIARKGSAPRGCGTKMLVLPDGACAGTAGGGLAEEQIRQKAAAMLAEHTRHPQICRIDLTGKEAGDEGMVCGGVIDVLLEVMGE